MLRFAWRALTSFVQVADKLAEVGGGGMGSNLAENQLPLPKPFPEKTKNRNETNIAETDDMGGTTVGNGRRGCGSRDRRS